MTLGESVVFLNHDCLDRSVAAHTSSYYCIGLLS